MDSSLSAVLKVAVTVFAVSIAIGVMGVNVAFAVVFGGAMIYYFEPNFSIMVLEVGLSVFSIAWLFWIAMENLYHVLTMKEGS